MSRELISQCSLTLPKGGYIKEGRRKGERKVIERKERREKKINFMAKKPQYSNNYTIFRETTFCIIPLIHTFYSTLSTS